MACRWVHRPPFFFGLQAKAPRVDPRAACRLLEPGRKRGGTWSRRGETGRGTADCGSPAQLSLCFACRSAECRERERTTTDQSLAPCTARRSKIHHTSARRAADVLTMVKIPEPDADKTLVRVIWTLIYNIKYSIITKLINYFETNLRDKSFRPN